MNQDAISLGGIVGSVLGVLGGIVGTYFYIKNAKTPAERIFVTRFSAGLWMAGLLLVGLPVVLSLIGLVPEWFDGVTVILFGILLAPANWWANRRRATLRERQGPGNSV